MTHVGAKCCETCSHGIARWGNDERRPEWLCEKDQFGNEECGVYEREPGVDG